MNEKKQCPDTRGVIGAFAGQNYDAANQIAVSVGKDTTEILSLQERRVYYYLLNAEFPKSVADITRALGQCDPRRHIKGLRDKGVPVQDTWCYCKEHGRYKRYFLPNPLRG